MPNQNQSASFIQVSGFKSPVSSATPSLLPLIFQEIEATGGTISFHRFMELALYHPEHGYYTSGRARIGKEGDFFTSVSVGRVYGRLLASICQEVWERLGSPSEFTIVEQGANDGTLASDILQAVNRNDRFANALRYLIVEPFSTNREIQQQNLSNAINVDWVDSPEELPLFSGIHLSNELLDAFPVHSLRWNGTEWVEDCVCRNESQLGWTTRPIVDQELMQATVLLPRDLPQGFRTEWNPGIRPWLEKLHERMERGVILTVDYGQAGGDHYAPHRADGTVLAYQSHRRFTDPLQEAGLRDITAQVDFTMFAKQACKTGFAILGYSDQHHFLVGAAEPWLRSLGDSAIEHQKDLRALQSLIHPNTMGMQFKAIGLGKKFPAEPPLSCFRYSDRELGSLGV